MNVTRAALNPLITPKDVTPSSPDMIVVGAFNPAAVQYRDETLLLLRVAETVRDVHPDEVAVPIVNCANETPCIHIERIPRNTPGLDLSDSRSVVVGDRLLLTSLSHLRLARSRDGVNFTIDAQPAIFPCEPYEEYGIEDPRITLIDGTYYINYTAVSHWGIGVALASTKDFKTFTKHGLIFSPDNKDVVIFAGKVNGQYMAMHRPSTGGLGNLQMWLATSPDLLHWGNHQPLIAKRKGMWDGVRIGAGDVPILTDAGWLTIYHGVNRTHGYCLGALLLDKDNPRQVIGRSDEPILFPEREYECTGFFGNVVFSCGSVLDEHGVLRIYYGSADEHTCCAWVELDELLASLPAPSLV